MIEPLKKIPWVWLPGIWEIPKSNEWINEEEQKNIEVMPVKSIQAQYSDLTKTSDQKIEESKQIDFKKKYQEDMDVQRKAAIDDRKESWKQVPKSFSYYESPLKNFKAWMYDFGKWILKTAWLLVFWWYNAVKETIMDIKWEDSYREEFEEKKEEERKNPESVVSKNFQLSTDDVWLSGDYKKIDEIYNSNSQLINSTISYNKNIFDIAKSYEDLKKQLDQANVDNDQDKIAEVNNKIDENLANQIKEQFAYIEWQYVTWSSSKEVFDNIRSIWWDMTDSQIYSLLSKWTKKKFDEAKKYWDEIDSLQMKYRIKADMNQVNIITSTINKTFDEYWEPLTDSQNNIIINNLYSDIPEIQQQARNNWTEDRYKIWLSIFNDQMLDTLSNIWLDKWSELAKDNYLNIAWSKELKDYRNLILSESQKDEYYDENWNFDRVKFFDSIKDKEQAILFFGKVWYETAEVKSEQKMAIARQSDNEFSRLWKTAWALYYDNISKPVEQEDYLSYKRFLEWKEKTIRTGTKYINEFIYTKDDILKRIQERSAYLADPFFVKQKKQDVTYAQDPLNRASDTLTSIKDLATRNPWETFTVLWSLAVPFTKVSKLWKLWEATKLIENWVLRKMARIWVDIAWETIEWNIINFAFDSLWAIENPDMRYMLIDPVIWLVRWVKMVSWWDIQWMTKKILNQIDREDEISSLEKWSEKYWEAVNNRFRQEWLWELLMFNNKTLKDFVVNGKIKTSDIAAELERSVWKYINSTNPLVEHSKQILIDESWNLRNIWKEWENTLVEAIKKKMGNQYDEYSKRFVENWVLNKPAMIIDSLVSEKNTADKLSKLWFIRAQNYLATWTGIMKEIDSFVDTNMKELNNLIKNNPASSEIFNKTKAALLEWQWNMKMIPYYIHTKAWVEKISSMQKQVDDIVKTINNYSQTKKETPKILDIMDLPKEIKDNINDPQKLSQIIFGDEKKAEKYWVKVYDVNDFVKKNNEYLVNTIWAKETKRLWDIINIISDVNEWKIKIYELPWSIKSFIWDISWFTTFAKDWDSTQLIIWTVWWMVDFMSWKKWVTNVEYVKSVIHELWHTIMLSLNDKIKWSITNAASNIFDKWASISDIKKIIPNLNKARLAFLSKLSTTDSQKFIEEVSADIVWNFIQKKIFWTTWDIERNWENFLNKISQWLAVNINNNETIFDIIANRFTKLVQWLFNYNWKWTIDDYKNMLHYIASWIVDWQRNWVDIWKAWEKMKALWTIESIEKWDVLKAIDDTSKANNTYFAYKVDWDIVSTTKQWVTNFDIAKLYSEDLVRDALFNDSVSKDQLWLLLSISFDNTLSKYNILQWASDDQIKKFNEAISISQDKHKLAISNLQKFYDKKTETWDLTKEIDWKNIFETISNVWVRITKQWVLEFAGQDLIKFLNISNKEEYNAIFKLYLDDTIKVYDKKVLTKVEDALNKLWYKWNTISEKYISFSNDIEKRIIDAAQLWWITDKKFAEELAKDVSSRLFVGAPWYLSVLQKNADSILPDFPQTIAYWLVKKNLKKTDSWFYANQYESILNSMKWANIENAENIAEIFGKEMSLWKDVFEWQSYSKQFFNFLSARTENFIINALRNSDIKSLKMGIWDYFSYMRKIWWIWSQYSTVVENKFSRLWILEDLNLNWATDYKDTSDLINFYLQTLNDDKEKIISKIWEKEFTKLFNEVDSLRKWLTNDDARFLSEKLEKDFSNYTKWISVDDYFNDIQSVESTIEEWTRNSESAKVWLNWQWQADYVLTSSKFESDAWKESVNNVLSVLDEYNKLVWEIKSEWFNWAFAKIVDNKYLNTFFNVKWNSFEIQTKIKNISKWTKTYEVEFNETQNQWKIAFLSWLAWTYANVATVAESDKKISKIVFDSIWNMWKQSPIERWWAIDTYLKARGIEWKFISNKTLMETMEKDFAEELKMSWDSTFVQITNDITSVYMNKFWREWTAMYSWISPNYKNMIDAYVEMLWKRRFELWLLKKDELSKIFQTIEKEAPYSLWTRKHRDMDKLLWLWGNWLWMSYNNIMKMEDKAKLFNKHMFSNFLYSTFKESEYSFWLSDTLIKWFKRFEKWLASAQYALFYSVLWTWFPAAWQQVMSNAIHLLWKKLTEIWAENIDNIDSMSKLIDNMVWSELWKLDIFADRPELIKSMTDQSKIWKAWRVFDRVLSYQSALTWADKSMENMVKKYSITSALLEKNFTAKSAEEFITNFWKISDEYVEKWYNSYVKFENLVMYWSDRTLDQVWFAVNKMVSEWKLTSEEWLNVIWDFKRYIADTRQIKDVIQNARIKDMTFYQMASNPDLVQNIVWWRVGAMNMRFLNRASRKAWDYMFKLVDSITKWDRKWITKIITQLAGEWLYATKAYLLFNNLAEWWVDWKQAMASFWLPYTVISMASFGALDTITQFFIDRWANEKIWLSLWQSLQNSFMDFWRKMSWRVAMSPVYRVSQYWKIKNWLDALEENPDMEDVYSTKFAWIPIAQDIAEIFSNIIFSRLWRFDTISSAWYYRDYVWLDAWNTLLNFISNQKITNDVVWADKLINSFFDLTKTDDSWKTLSWNIIPYSRDQKLALRAQDKFMKDQWLIWFYSWTTFNRELFDRLESQLDDANLKKMYQSMWTDIWIMANESENSDIENFSNELYEDWILSDKTKIAEIKKTYGNKTYDFFMNHIKMTWLEEQKQLINAWKWITEEEIKKYNSDVEEFTLKVENEILSMQKTNPKLIKNAAYDDMKKLKIIEDWKNRFWEQMMLWIWIDAMAKTHKSWLKDILIAEKWKEWMKQNINDKSWEVLAFLEKENGKYKSELMAKYYTTALLWNRTLWKDMALMYTNTSSSKPLKEELDQNIWIWTIIVPSIIQKIVESQWINSLWINNAFTDMNTKLWNWAWWLEEWDKSKWLDSIIWYKLWVFDYIDKYVDKSTANNVKIWIASSDINHLEELKNNPELLEKSSQWIKDYLDRITVSEPLTDEKIMDNIRSTIFKEPWKWWKKRKDINFDKLNFNLNKVSDFKTDFYRYVLKKEPLEHISYAKQGSSTIVPIRMPAAEARPPKAEYNFIKVKEAEKETTPDIKVETIKTSKTPREYKWKVIKMQNIYTVKTTRRWAKK